MHSLAFNYVNIYIAVLILQLEFFDTRIFELKQQNYLRDLHFKIYGQLNLIDVSLMQMSFSKMCFWSIQYLSCSLKQQNTFVYTQV